MTVQKAGQTPKIYKKKKELSRPKRHDHEVKTRIAKKMKPG